jgi:hypothetical protein
MPNPINIPDGEPHGSISPDPEEGKTGREELPPLSPEAKERYDGLKALAAETARHAKPGATSDHSDMYDDFGLPI